MIAGTNDRGKITDHRSTCIAETSRIGLTMGGTTFMEGTRLVGPSKLEVGLTAHTSCGDEWSLQPPGCSSQFASKEQLCTNGKGIWVTREFYLVTRYLEERELPRGLEEPGVMIHPAIPN